MSFFENLSKIAETITDATSFVQGLKAESIGDAIANKVSGSILKTQTPKEPEKPETGPTIVTLNPSVENKIPVCYGVGFTKGIVVDAALDADNQSIWISYVLSEVTGNKINGSASEFTLEQVLIDGYEGVFAGDGIHIAAKQDSEGNQDTSINNLIEVYFYADGSEEYKSPLGYDPLDSTVFFAYNNFPNWTSNHIYYKMCFAIVKITYSQEKDLTYLPEFTFKIRNSMDQPGDVLNDYLKSTIYGAGIPEEELNQ
jgi:hypothetical protein